MKKYFLIYLIGISSFGQVSNDKIYNSINEALSNPLEAKILYLSDTNLIELPIEILKLEKLERIELDGNPNINIEQVLGIISKIKNLKYLDLSEDNISILPETIGSLKNLEFLYLDDNNISVLPKSINNLSKLIELHIDSNKLYKLSFIDSDLPNLTNINLNYNDFTEFPIELCTLKNIRRVMLWYNKISFISEKISEFENIEELNLDSNYIDKIPKSVSKLKTLKTLSLKGNLLNNESINIICNLSNLENLNLEENKLTAISKKISELSQLTNLNLSKNKIKNLPNSIKKMNLIQIGLGRLPELNWSRTFELLSKIETLERVGMYSMNIEKMPYGFEKLTQVRVFWLTFNLFDFKEKERIEKLHPKAKIEFK